MINDVIAMLCVWEGNATIYLTLTINGTAHKVQLETYNKRELAVEEYNISFVKLNACRQENPENYQLIFIISFETVMDAYIAQQMETNNTCGLSVVVVDNNRVIYQKGFGFADKENNIAVTDSSLFHIGSITKLFTGIGIMQLVQKRLINIDEPIQKYMPEFSVKYHHFTKIFRSLKKPDLPDVPHTITVPDYQKKLISGSYCVLYDLLGDLYFENDTLFFHQLHSERIPMVYHADDWFSFYYNGMVIPGTRLGVRFINGQKVLCAENRDEFAISRMVIGNALSKRDTLPDYVNEMLGVYVDAASGYPALNLYIDSLSQSKIKLLAALSFGDNIPTILKPAENNTFIIQGMGRGAQETVYFSGDTANYGGYKFVKFQDLQESSVRAQTAMTDAVSKTTVKLTAPEDVILNLKKALKKNNLF